MCVLGTELRSSCLPSPNTPHNDWSRVHVSPTRSVSEYPLGASPCSWLPFCLSIRSVCRRAAGHRGSSLPEQLREDGAVYRDKHQEKTKSGFNVTLTVKLCLIYSCGTPHRTPPCLSEQGWDNVSAIFEQRTLDMQIRDSV